MEETVWKLRTWIYGIGILALVFSVIYKSSYLHAKEVEQECNIEDTKCFWPPDMIPHPTPPWDGPSEPNQPQPADRD